MRNKTKGAVAGLAGLALLAGGSTFALWNQSAGIDGGTITHGDLNVVALGDGLSWVDATPYRTGDFGHVIDPANWRMVPGDIAEGTQGFDIALRGDNLSATLSLTKDGATQTDTLPDGVSITYDVVNAVTGQPIVSGVGLGSAVVYLQSPDNSNPDPAFTTVGSALNNQPDLKVVVRVTFADTVTGRTSVNDGDLLNAQTILRGLSVDLEQIRNPGPAGA